MNADSFYCKGNSHKWCQDYTIHGENREYAYAIVCDGCSSSEKTDLGARLLAESFARNLSCSPITLFFPEIWEQQLSSHLKAMVAGGLKDLSVILGLAESAFDATLLAAVYSKRHNRLMTFQWGDGRVTKGFKDGRIEQSKIVYSKNAPAYFSYFAFPEREERYRQEFSGQKAILWKSSPEQLFDIKGEVGDLYVESCDASTLKYVHLTSDGIESFRDVNDNSIDVSSEFTAFKGFQGEFVQRRMNRILKETKKEGASHYDDLGVAAIAFD